jgi:hypothetical protein
MAVGGHRKIFDTEGVETRYIVFDAVANEWLAAGDADLADTEAKKNAREPVEFGPGEDFVVIAVIFGIGGTAVDAAEITAVRDGDAQVGDLAPEFVVKGHRIPEKIKPDPVPRIGRTTEKYTFPSKSLLSKHGFTLRGSP